MNNFDKIALGAVFVTLTLFWVIITPAGVTSRPSQAAIPAQTNAPTAADSKVEQNKIDNQTVQKTQRRTALAKIEKLKRRNSDTPDESQRDLHHDLNVVDDTSAPSLPADIESLESFSGDRDIPTFY